MASKLTVFNDALGLLGQPLLESDDQAGEDGETLRGHWDSAIKIAHEKTAWDFAKTRAQLARQSDVPVSGYQFYYSLPANARRILWYTQTGSDLDRLIDYEGETGRIATDAQAVYCVYVSDDSLTQLGDWSESFAYYVATELAFKAAPKINQSAMESIAKERKKALSDAIGLDATQGPPKRRPMGSWAKAARTGYSREQR